MVQQVWGCLMSTGMQIQSPTQQSGLRIQHCCSCTKGRNCGSDLILAPGTSVCCGAGVGSKKNKRVDGWNPLLRQVRVARKSLSCGHASGLTAEHTLTRTTRSVRSQPFHGCCLGTHRKKKKKKKSRPISLQKAYESHTQKQLA